MEKLTLATDYISIIIVLHTNIHKLLKHIFVHMCTSNYVHFWGIAKMKITLK